MGKNNERSPCPLIKIGNRCVVVVLLVCNLFCRFVLFVCLFFVIFSFERHNHSTKRDVKWLADVLHVFVSATCLCLCVCVCVHVCVCVCVYVKTQIPGADSRCVPL